MKVTIGAITSAWLVILGSLAQLFAQEPAQQQQPEFIKQGQQLMREGKLQDALALYRQILQISPDSLAASLAAGNTLDLMEKGEEARKDFKKAIEVAHTPEGKASAKRAMARCHTLSRGIAGKPLSTNNRVSTSTAA